MRVTDRMLAGLQFAYSEYKGDFGNGGGDFKLREPMLTVYGGYGEGPWYVGATLGVGRSTTAPTAPSCSARRRAPRRATPTGYHNVARLLGGYWFKYQDWNHGPFAKLTYEKIVVRQFSENGSDSTALTYNQQKNDAFWSSLGWQVAGNVQRLPAVRARHLGVQLRHRHATGVRQVEHARGNLRRCPASCRTTTGGCSISASAKDFGRVTGFLSGNVSAGKGDGDYWAVTVGIRVPL